MATVPSPTTAASGGKILAATWNTDVRDSDNFFLLNSPAAFMSQGTVQTAVVASTWTSITLDGEALDRDAGHDTVTNNSRYVCKTIGWYRVSGMVACPSNATGTTRQSRIALNGVAINGSQSAGGPVAALQSLTTPVVLVQATAVTDYIEVQFFHDATTAQQPTVSAAFRSSLVVQFVGS